MKYFKITLQLILGTAILVFSLKISAYISMLLDKNIFGGDLKASIIGAFIVSIMIWPIVCLLGIFFIFLGMRNLSNLKKK